MNNSTLSFIPPELAPCGVFCGACPSLGKSCHGCASQNQDQKRKTKWACKIRVCCYEQKKFSFCVQCDDFPCKIYHNKLLKAHQGDPKYKYRHEIPTIILQQYDDDLSIFLERQKKRWQCPDCGGTIYFYHYICDTCGKKYYI
jgi:hypothetical protein